MTKWIFALDDPVPEDVSPAALLGGKGLSLRKIAGAGLTVPRGFTISSQACRRFFELNRGWPEGLQDELEESLTRLAESLDQKSDRSAQTQTLAVRSGAEVSMPGMLETVLDCPCTLKDVLGAVRVVFESWHGESARAWRERQGLDHTAGTAVTIQELVEPVSAGVLFTTAPADDSHDHHMLVEAVAGRGDSLVSGDVTPARLLLNRDLSSDIHEDATSDEVAAFDQLHLPEKPLQQLREAGHHLAEIFGCPLDIEWGRTDTGFVFFQARPISCSAARPIVTSGGAQTSASSAGWLRDTVVDRFSALFQSGPTKALVRHNLSESLSFPTPMTWSLVRRMMSGGLGRLYRALGYAPSRRVRNEGVLQLVAGQVYADPDRMPQLLSVEWPLCHDYDLLRREPHRLDAAPRHFDPDRTHPLLLLLLPHLAFVSLRATRRIRRLMNIADSEFHATASNWSGWVKSESQRSLTDCTQAALLKILFERIHHTIDEFAAVSLLPGTVGAIAEGELHRRICRVANEDTADQVRQELLTTLDVPVHRRQTDLLRRMARSENVQDEFVAEFGHRGPGEMELACPRWREQPPTCPNSPGNEEIASENAAPKNWQSVLQRVASASPRLKSELLNLAETAQRLLPFRETGRHELMRGFDLIRQTLKTIGHNSGLGDDVFFLTPDELSDRLPTDRCQALIDSRRQERQAAQKLRIPDFLDAESVTSIQATRDGLPGAVRTGDRFPAAATLSPGIGSGPVVRIDSTRLPREVQPGSVIVTESIDPAMTPLLLQASGVIVERGGLLSHGAIVARQLGLPVLLCEPDAGSASLQDQQHVELDTEQKQVRVFD